MIVDARPGEARREAVPPEALHHKQRQQALHVAAGRIQRIDCGAEYVPPLRLWQAEHPSTRHMSSCSFCSSLLRAKHVMQHFGLQMSDDRTTDF